MVVSFFLATLPKRINLIMPPCNNTIINTQVKRASFFFFFLNLFIYLKKEKKKKKK